MWREEASGQRLSSLVLLLLMRYHHQERRVVVIMVIVVVVVVVILMVRRMAPVKGRGRNRKRKGWQATSPRIVIIVHPKDGSLYLPTTSPSAEAIYWIWAYQHVVLVVVVVVVAVE